MSHTSQTAKEQQVVTLLQQIAEMVGLELTDGQMRASLRLIEDGANPHALVHLILRKRQEKEMTNTSVSSSSQHSQYSRNSQRPQQYIRGSEVNRVGKGKGKHEIEYTDLHDLNV